MLLKLNNNVYRYKEICTLVIRIIMWFFSGFDAYVGFMHMENAHFNPIVLTFLSLLKSKTASDTKNKKGIGNGKRVLFIYIYNIIYTVVLVYVKSVGLNRKMLN